MSTDLEKRVATEYLSSSEGSDAARLQFMMGLWETQALTAPSKTRFEPPTQQAARDALVNGRFLFALQPPVLDRGEYLDALASIVDYVADSAVLAAEQSEALSGLDLSSVVTEGAFASASISPATWIAETSEAASEASEGVLTVPTMAFVLHAALVPFLTGPAAEAMESLGDFDYGAWGSGDCPVCGTPAAMGRMGESTRLQGADRMLWCGTCHAEWGYERIRCARCGCRNQEKLRYVFVEDDPAHRVHLCEDCHGYVRFVFEDKLGKPTAMLVEDVITTPLSAVAAQQGYTTTGDGGSGSC